MCMAYTWHVHGICMGAHMTRHDMQVLRDEGLAENARLMGKLPHALSQPLARASHL